MNQQSQITDADLQMLLAQNPMAAEQLRRIIAERQTVELQAELKDLHFQADHLIIGERDAKFNHAADALEANGATPREAVRAAQAVEAVDGG